MGSNPFLTGDMVSLRNDVSKKRHVRTPAYINDSVDLWPDPHSRAGWLTVPSHRFDKEDVAIILECYDSSCRVLTSKGHVGWLETWDIQKL